MKNYIVMEGSNGRPSPCGRFLFVHTNSPADAAKQFGSPSDDFDELFVSEWDQRVFRVVETLKEIEQ